MKSTAREIDSPFTIMAFFGIMFPLICVYLAGRVDKWY